MNKKKRRLFGKKYLPEYLKELNTLTNIEVTPQELISIEKSDLINTIKHDVSKNIMLNFNDKEKLLILIGRLINIKNGPSYLYTTYAKDCGLLKLNSINDFNINFNFTDEHAGFIKFILQDLSNEISLDFYEEDGEQLLEIEISGNEWCQIEIDH
ncbi:hypothetical protein [Flavobacterium sp. MK4S-17]|uniref:hypothetical protein n=1 Tax=Flavobacterium sp. MK4S-17 TaxID=2543737 RepID=UPI001359ECBD|nr:hypothetical protein [Flavobacterium sp. MK4S-17]